VKIISALIEWTSMTISPMAQDRVLPTRARQGMVILVPRGTEVDQTRPPLCVPKT
jgi:hypothetical protein